MREQIAVLDGVPSGLGQGIPGWDGRHQGPVPGNGQDYTGGSSYPDSGGFPYTLQAEGLAGMGGVGGLSAEYVNVPADVKPSWQRTFFGAAPSAWDGAHQGPVPGNGQNYSGGSAYPDSGGFPYSLQAEGLAGLRSRRSRSRRGLGYAMPGEPDMSDNSAGLQVEYMPGGQTNTETPVPGNGQNYTGGSSWAEGFPTTTSSNGLVGLDVAERRAALVAASRAIKMYGLSRTAGDAGRMVAAAIQRGFGRRPGAFGPKKVAYMVAILIGQRAGVTVHAQRWVAKQVAAAA